MVEQEVIEEEKEFSGNYIENFEQNDSDDYYPGPCKDWEKIGQQYFFHGENCSLEVTIVTNDILKFRYGVDGYFEDDFSYAIDPEFKPEEVNSDFKERGLYYAIRTANLKCYVYKNTLKTKIFDESGTVLMDDEKGFHWREEKTFGGNVVMTTKKIRKGEQFFGLGDKTGPLNLKGSRKHLWGTDCYGYGNDTDPVYKNIPFYQGLADGIGYGVFMDNTFRSFFDYGAERKSVCSFWAQGGEMRYYFINGPKLIDVIRRYTELTGKPSMPPKWSLGYHQSKWSYYPEGVVRDLAKKFRDEQIPCDVIHLDIDYMDGFRCFTWDKERFPDPANMIKDLESHGFKSIVIIDPGIKIDKNYWVYQQGISNNYFCTRGDGPLLKGSVWPGPCHFPDFTNPKVRDWWAGLFEGLVKDGVSGVWNDMNEPAVFEEGTFPFDARHDYDGHPCTHRKAHNVYGSLMAKSTKAGMARFFKKKRPFAITRSAYAGIQKHASVWTGDNVASWEHLKIANIQCQRLGVSGVSFAGSDVGGFIGTPSGELFVRWIQMAVFHPFFRTHSSGDHGHKEPWVFGEPYTSLVRKYIEMRYELLPYIYSSFYQYSQYGTPMIQSLNLVAQDDPETFLREEEFMLGESILVVPVSEEGATSRKLYLPAGGWYDFWSGDYYDGKQEIQVKTPMDKIPIFIKSGSILPRQPIMQYTDEFEFEELRLDFYSGEDDYETFFYEDAGDGMEYQGGEYMIRKWTTQRSQSAFIIRQEVNGRYDSCYSSFRATFHGSTPANLVMVDGNNITDEMTIEENGVFSFSVPKNFEEIIIS